MNELARLRLEPDGEVAVAALSGEVDLSNSRELGDRIAGAGLEARRGIVVDLSDVTFLDSAGVAALYAIVRRLSDAGRAVAVVAPETRPVRQTLVLTSLHTMIPVEETVAAARAALGQPCG